MDSSTNDTPAADSAQNSGKSYRVEVSGWDAPEDFFVEKTSLDWKEPEGKSVALHAAIRLDSVLFIRLLRPLGGGAGIPVPYRAVRVEAKPRDETAHVVCLEPLQPRLGLRERVARLIDGVVTVA